MMYYVLLLDWNTEINELLCDILICRVSPVRTVKLNLCHHDAHTGAVCVNWVVFFCECLPFIFTYHFCHFSTTVGLAQAVQRFGSARTRTVWCVSIAIWCRQWMRTWGTQRSKRSSKNLLSLIIFRHYRGWCCSQYLVHLLSCCSTAFHHTGRPFLQST